MEPLNGIELMVRCAIADSILVCRDEGIPDHEIAAMIEDGFAAHVEHVGLGPGVWEEETWAAAFRRQMRAIFTPEGIKLC